MIAATEPTGLKIHLVMSVHGYIPLSYEIVTRIVPQLQSDRVKLTVVDALRQGLSHYATKTPQISITNFDAKHALTLFEPRKVHYDFLCLMVS